MTAIKTKMFMDDFAKSVKDGMGINFKPDKKGNYQANVNLDSLVISIKDAENNKHLLAVTVGYKFKGRIIAGIGPVEVSKGGNIEIGKSEGFSCKIKLFAS